jgi:hypothetical protein
MQGRRSHAAAWEVSSSVADLDRHVLRVDEAKSRAVRSRTDERTL